MNNAMDNSSLRNLSTRELALHLRHASEKQSASSVSTHLLTAIELEILPPTVFDTFLTAVGSPCPLKDALWQRHSKHIRHAAILRFGRDLKSVDWKDAWQEVGGMEGLLDLFSQLPVSEAKKVSKAIASCPTRSAVKNGIERQRRITELLQCLMWPLYPSSPYESRDQRPLRALYVSMVPACTSDFVESLLRQESHPLLKSLPRKWLVQHHFDLLRRLVLDAISQEDSLKDAAAQRLLDYIPLLLQSTPPVPVSEPNFSASMSLAVSILERITQKEEARFPERIFMPRLMVPLARRLQANKVEPNRVLQIVQLATEYIQRHEHARTQLSPVKGNLIFYIADYWSNAGPLFKECLIYYISLLRDGSQRALTYYRNLINHVAEPQRYDLLRIICLHGIDNGVDIESDDGLKTVPIESWPIYIFQVLQQDHSLSLLQRLVRLKPEANFLELPSGRTILSQPRSPSSRFGDTRLLLTILQGGKKAAEHEEQKSVLQTFKTQATKSREQKDRAFFAKSAAFHAIVSGSLELYGDVVQWTRRFLRDALTVKTIYSQYTTCTVEGIALLGGIPKDLDPWSAADIRTRITKANSIMLTFLEMAVTSLREPSFHAPDWTGPRSLFRDVVMSRMDDAGRLKSHFHLSEDEIYELLWSETLAMLLHAEDIGLQYESLGFNSPHGLLGHSCNTVQMAEPALRSFYRFLDNLARSRNALWIRSRPTMEPAVAALKPPWPRGLPIQCLTGPVNVAVDSAFTHTPFLADRAAEVVFADPAVALVDVPDDKEMRHAIGQFEDSFGDALAIYVMQCPTGYERDSRVHAVWSHAINALSHGRLSKDEAELFWRDIFRKAIPHVKLPDSEIKINQEYPVIPTDVDPREPFEWNPAALVTPEVESRELPVKIVDCMIAAPRSLQWNTSHEFCVPKPKTQGIVSAPIWSRQRLEHFHKIPKSVQEGMIATALLVESGYIQGPSRILASPFPSEFNIRYPSLFLDHDFLLSRDFLNPPAEIALSYFIKMVPSTLLLDLTVSALDALSMTPSDSTKLAFTERTAYQLLKLLSRSDRPNLASNLIVRFILDRPDASSWHRQLLTKSFIRNLWAAEAQDIISFFASSILEILQHQVTSSGNQQKVEGSTTSSDRFIKITTVKFLAQILDNADFVPPEFCVDVLSKLLQTASHLDILVAVLESMLSRLGRCSDSSSNTLTERLMSALEMAIPTLGSLNERKETQDADWTEAEKTGKLPEVYEDGGMKALPPMLNVILNALTSHGTSSGILRTGLIRRIVLPVIDKSKEQSARWVKMFTLKHLPDGQSIQTPSFPIRPGILANLIQKCSSEVPQYILDLYQQFFLTNLWPLLC